MSHPIRGRNARSIRSKIRVAQRYGAWLSVALMLAAPIGCKETEADDAKASRATPPKVNLPPSPKMVEPRFVEKYADGSYTVAGLIAGRAKLMGKEVKLKGFVKEIHRCSPDELQCDPPKHAVLVDDLTRPRSRLVVIGDDDTRFSALVQGEAVVLEGFYQQTDPGGLFVRMEGLLVLVRSAPEFRREAPGGEDAAAEGATEGADKAESEAADPDSGKSGDDDAAPAKAAEKPAP
ncbi:MAG: hypothetical protein ACI9OJ_003307 [Myxococcota bacterium]